MRTRLIFLLSLLPLSCLLGAATLLSAPKEDVTDSAVTLTDDQVVRYLTASEALQWEQARNLQREGHSDIESGEWLKTRGSSALGIRVDSARARQAGDERIRQGRGKIESAEAQLEQLRAKAQRNYQEMMTLKVEEYGLNIPLSDWENFSTDAVQTLLNTLWSKGFNRLYYAGSYFLDEDDGYQRIESIDENLRGRLLSSDDRYSVLLSDDFQLSLEPDGERYQLTFPDWQTVVSSFQPAAIFLQLVPLDEYGVILCSLRGIDLANGRIVANQTVLLADPLLGDWLREAGLSRPEVKAVEPAVTAMRVNLTDQAEFTARVQRQRERFLFNVLYRDEARTATAEAQLVAFKALTTSIVDGCTSDTDFLFSIAASVDEDSEQAAISLLSSENAVWLLSPESAEQRSVEGHLELLARSLHTQTDVEVGFLTYSMVLATVEAETGEENAQE